MGCQSRPLDTNHLSPITFQQFGLHGTFKTKTRTGLYYKAGKDRMLTFVLTRDTAGDRPTQIFYCTNLEMNVQQILSTILKKIGNGPAWGAINRAPRNGPGS